MDYGANVELRVRWPARERPPALRPSRRVRRRRARRRRGCHVGILRRRVAAPPRPRAGYSVGTSRGGAAAATWIVHGNESRRHRRASQVDFAKMKDVVKRRPQKTRIFPTGKSLERVFGDGFLTVRGKAPKEPLDYIPALEPRASPGDSACDVSVDEPTLARGRRAGTGRGAAASASWIFRGDELRRRRGRELDIPCGDESRRRRGWDVDSPWRRVAAAPWLGCASRPRRHRESPKDNPRRSRGSAASHQRTIRVAAAASPRVAKASS